MAQVGQSARAACARLIGRYADGVCRAADRALRRPGADNVHDLRVATRRLRAVLKALGELLEPARLEELSLDLAELTRETGPVRDADVRRQSLMPLIRQSQALPPDARRMCSVALEQARADARRDLRRRMREAEWKERMVRIRSAAHHGRLVRPLPQPLAQFVGMLVHAQLRDLRRRMGRRRLDPDRLHRVRVRVRNLRYVAEGLLPLAGMPARSLAKSLRRLQDRLGEAHDLVEAQEFLCSGALPQDAGATLARGLKATGAERLRAARRALHDLARDPPAEWRPWLKRGGDALAVS